MAEDGNQAAAPELARPRGEVANALESQVEEGRELLESKIVSARDLADAKSALRRWEAYNRELLSRHFTTQALKKEYDAAVYVGLALPSDTLQGRISNFRRDVRRHIDALEAIRGRLDLIPEAGYRQPRPSPEMDEVLGNRVFVVHGHDNEARETVARFIERLGLDPIILHEQPNRGRTLIQKFEDYADVGFAVVLLTPDDEATPRRTPKRHELRARQNVIFELGFLIGRLGRDRVCPLYKGELTLPSDYAGVAYVPLDDAGGWKLTLIREIRAAGFEVDANQAL